MTKERSSIRLLAIIMVSAMLAACGGGETSPDASGSGGGGSGGTGSATLSWTAPVENHDGTAITNLAGYHIYHGTSVNALNKMVQVSNPGITLYVVDNLPAGTHYFSITAYNTAGVESDRSAVASKSIM
jgi:hypothetical protein